ncbi:MAG TPA: threonine--tRNA ligase [Candidatus Saccharimonadales bacterium]|nr:threonine--tRNA ligase [Candidatus Saccharimonadales bacterium]
MAAEIYEKTNLYKLRHSAAHVLAMAAIEFDPKVKLAIGPPIESGFYYDFEFTKPLGPDDLKTLEKTMRSIINKNIVVEHKTMSHQEAVGFYKKTHQPFKQELAENLTDKELGFYGIGEFWDLCKGPHVKSTGEIKAFKLLSIAGAYWRGDEHQPMLTRIYGTAFETVKELDAYIDMLEEAKKRDHRKLGSQLDLFTFSDLVGPGLPLWTPKGMALRESLDNFIWELRQKYGYEKVEIPHITKKALYETSGHWEKFKDELMKIATREGHEYALKPMNCPHHTQIFNRKKWSYRQLPQRYANTTMVYRDEQSGELSGLSRVLSITQDDAHVFCRADQVKEEIGNVWNIIEEFYGALGFKPTPRLSTRDPQKPEQYLGSPAIWDQAEKALADLVKKRGATATTGVGDATFYGPKIDFMAKDSLGREHQVATIQLDMNMPGRFGLTYTNEEGKEAPVVMIHVAIAGSLERCIAILIEHFAGEFPLWLAPVQAVVLPISEKFVDYAREVGAELKKNSWRVEVDESDERLGKRIRNAELQKIPFVLVVGEKEVADRTVSVRMRHTAEQPTVPLNEFVKNYRPNDRSS